MRLGDLPNSVRASFVLILRYLYRPTRPSSTLCFTYRGIRTWLTYNRIQFEYHTLERAIRWLAENRVLKRIRKGRTVIFCPGKHFFDLKYDYERSLEAAAETGSLTREYRDLLAYLKA